MINKKESNLWDIILWDDFHQKHKSIESFRQIGGFNNRLTSWDVIDTSSRYFKSLLYAFAENLDNRIIQSEIFHQKDNKLKDEKCFGQFLFFHSALYESKNSLKS